MAELRQMGFELTPEVKEALIEGYDNLDEYFQNNTGLYNENAIYDNINAISDPVLRDAQLNEFKLLLAMRNIIKDNYPSGSNDKNKVGLVSDQGILLLRAKNLGFSGLNFAIQDGRTIVFEKNVQTKKELDAKLAELYNVFSSLGLKSFDFNFPANCDHYRDVFEVEELKKEKELELQDILKFSGSKKSLAKEEQSVLDKMGAKFDLRVDLSGKKVGNNVRKRYLVGGWLQFDYYKDDKSMESDGEWDDKAKDYKHTATAKVKMKYDKKTGEAHFNLYVPHGGELDKNVVKSIIMATTAAGNTHIKVPYSNIAYMGIIWETCATDFVVPDAQGEAFPTAKDLRNMIGKQDGDKDLDPIKLSAWRIAMVKEIMDKKGLGGQDFSALSLEDRDKLGDYAEFVDSLKNSAGPLVSAKKLRADKFSDVIRNMSTAIREVGREDSSGEFKKFDSIDTISAGKAYKEIIKGYTAGGSFEDMLGVAFKGDAEKVKSCVTNMDLIGDPALKAPMSEKVLDPKFFTELMFVMSNEFREEVVEDVGENRKVSTTNQAAARPEIDMVNVAIEEAIGDWNVTVNRKDPLLKIPDRGFNERNYQYCNGGRGMPPLKDDGKSRRRGQGR